MRCITCSNKNLRIIKGLCRNCYERKRRKDNPEGTKLTNKKYRSKNREKINTYNKKYKYDLKLQIIKAYGGKCRCCKETIPEFLTIDHIYGGGKKHMKEIGGGRLYPLLKKQGYPKKEYQLLCFNCNHGKFFKGVCPHASDG